MTYITYLLSLCEHGDLHLRGASTNLLVILIKTTIHLLTLSSLSDSFNNSFINQCFLVSTDSQDNIQLYILAELLSAFRLCLDDNNVCVIHVSLNALRTLLSFLLINIHVEYLEDIYVLLNVLRSTTIRPFFFHNQHDELRLLLHFFKHPFI
ncbi:unnamed protein product [Rotaria sp. Silwood2]|nr:unnamed protein product [Rotaria sp. Silwood2]CAF4041567.1 unnamed protein product [Rotaria sp. Silwood2]